MSQQEDVAAAIKLHQAGQLDAAANAYRRILEVRPEDADALHLLGLVRHQQGDNESAFAFLARAVALDPQRPTFRFNYGTVLMARGDETAAEAELTVATELAPTNTAAWANLGTVRGKLADYEGAHHAFQMVLHHDHSHALGFSGLSAALNGLRRYEDALAAANSALDIDPDIAEAHLNRGNALQGMGLTFAALDAFERSASLAPNDPRGPYNLGNLHQDCGRLDEAAASFDEALARDPSHGQARSNRLMCELYREQSTEQSLYEAHRAWSSSELSPPPTPQSTISQPLKVAYVSPDFRMHSCAYFLEPVLANHDPKVVDVYCYADVDRPDRVTNRLKTLNVHWRDIAGWSDDAVIRQVEKDGIDLLIDLAGHTNKNRLSVFARRAARFQVSWLGYPATTGVPEIGWRLTDAIADPPGAADRWHTETLIRLPSGFHCYRPPADAPSVSSLPAGKTGQITFGSFNSLAKVGPATISLWAEILHAVPGSRLVLKGKSLDGDGARAHFSSAFERFGIGGNQLVLWGWIDRDDGPLAAYHDIDIGLDPFPYNGTTTTCEALWMGVPVVTLRGERHAARVGESLLSTIGRHDWIADDPASYRDTAVRLAGDTNGLALIRAGLREAVSASPLRDESGFARAMESAFISIVKGG